MNSNDYKNPNKPDSASEEKTITLVTFILSGEKYGIDIMQTNEIIKMEKITPIPNTMEFVEGVINLRGNIIPIIDLKKRFNLYSGENQANNIVVLKLEDMTIGIMIDAINNTISLSRDQILPPPPVVSGIGREYISGVARDEKDKLLILLDINKLVSYEEIEHMKEATSGV